MPRSYGITNAAPWATAPAVGRSGDTYYNTTSKTLFVSDGTSWIASGGGGSVDEVFIGPNDPGATYELWYDTDAPSTAAIASRNLLDNGQMAVNQRGVTSYTATSSIGAADRHWIQNNGIGVVNVYWLPTNTYNSPPPAGRPRPANIQYLQFMTAEAPGALSPGDYLRWQQGIEGLNLQHLAWGTTDAQPVTLSFDVYSTASATYVAELYRVETAGNRQVCQAFAIPPGFSTVTLTFPGDPTTLITNDSAARLYVFIYVGAGSGLTSTPLSATWRAFVATGEATGVSNNLAAIANNSFAVTNMQLEVGSSATPYQVRSYADELAACQRYLQVFVDPPLRGVFNTTLQAARAAMALPVTMRAAPTLSLSGTLTAYDGAVSITFTSGGLGTSFHTPSKIELDMGGAAGGGGPAVVGRPAVFYSNAGGILTVSAEI